jgi:4'-phosphopantetheinyl transferase
MEAAKGLMRMGASRRLGSGTVLVLVLEHEAELDDDRLAGLLDWSPEDLGRMARFRHRGAKTSWCLSRRLLRDALCELTGIGDAHRLMELGEFGKPFVRGCGLGFNWSHADGCVALAMANGREIGTDIESAQRPRGDYLDVARGFFTEKERDWIGREANDESWRRFLSLFVQKEAWLKATGRGLSLPLAEAPSAFELPPARRPGRLLLEIGRRGRYFLAVDATIGEGPKAPRFIVEERGTEK